MKPAEDPDKLFPKEPDEIVTQARTRFQRCEDWEANARKLFLEDIKFANADPDNGYQWPNKIKINRDVDEKPCLTINKVRQHNLQIINDAKQNKPSVNIRPVGDGASYQSSEIYEGVVRHIEYRSNAQEAYDTATKFQVQGGIGYWRVVTDYADAQSFDQDIFIRRIRDPLSVYIDPDANEADRSDARFAFIFDDMPKDEFKHRYPAYAHIAGQAALSNNDGWVDDQHVRVAEYFRCIEKKDKLVSVRGPDGVPRIYKFGDLPEQVHKFIVDDPESQTRQITYNEIEWYLIAGSEVIDKKIWPGRYIPIVAVVGEETIINGELDRKGHTRNMKDAQRMYNYWASSAVEQVALQSKTPYITPVQAIEGLETYWASANRINHAYLPYNHLDDTGQPIPPPERQAPPVMAQSYIQGLQMSREEMMEVSGQYQAQFGAPSNEKSGKAINERQRQGDNATYHFIDNLAVGIRFTGKILIDLIPKVYDTERVIKIMAEDGEESEVNINPQLKLAYQAKKVGEVNQVLFNPTVGKYSVEADIGPAYATKRQEAFNAISQILTQAPALVSTIGDLLFRNADFPVADKIAERLERMVPPEAKGEGPSPREAQLQMALQNATNMLKSQTEQLAEMKLKVKAHEGENEVKTYEALTSRLKVLLPTIINPADIARMVHDLMMEEHRNTLNMASQATANQQEEEPDEE